MGGERWNDANAVFRTLIFRDCFFAGSERLSRCGQINCSQQNLIKAAVAGVPLNAEIVAAMDADAAGRGKARRKS
jgi:hypothetical protein